MSATAAGNSSAWRHARHVVAENPVTGFALGLFVFFVLAAILGPSLAPHDPLASNTARALQAPSAQHWFGTDQIGRDIFSRVLVATRLDLGIRVRSAPGVSEVNPIREREGDA